MDEVPIPQNRDVGFVVLMKTSPPPDQSFQTVLQIFKHGGAPSGPSISPQLLEACVKVHDQLEIAAEKNVLSEQQGNLLEAMTGFIRSTPVIEALIEIAMAIVYDVGRAQGRSGIVMDLAQARGVSRQHADRQIKRGRVLLGFQRAGKSLMMPTGRKVEMIEDLPEEHWIPGWEFVVRQAEKKGKVSDKAAETALEIYKYQHLEPSPPELRPPAKPKSDTGPDPGAELQKAPNKKHRRLKDLAPEMANRVFAFLSHRARSRLSSTIRRGDPGRAALGVFLRLAGRKPEAKAKDVEGLFEALREKDPELVRRLEEKSRAVLLEEFSRMVEQYCAQLQKSAEDYRRRNGSPET